MEWFYTLTDEIWEECVSNYFTRRLSLNDQVKSLYLLLHIHRILHFENIEYINLNIYNDTNTTAISINDDRYSSIVRYIYEGIRSKIVKNRPVFQPFAFLCDNDLTYLNLIFTFRKILRDCLFELLHSNAKFGLLPRLDMS